MSRLCTFPSQDRDGVPALLADVLPHETTGLRAYGPDVVIMCVMTFWATPVDCVMSFKVITTDSGWVRFSCIVVLLVFNLTLATLVRGIAVREFRRAECRLHNRYCQWVFYARYRIPAPHRGWWWMDRRYAHAYARAGLIAKEARAVHALGNRPTLMALRLLAVFAEQPVSVTGLPGRVG